MTEPCIADELARRVLGWRPARDRYVKPGRSWVPRSRFRPFSDIRDAFRLLDAVTRHYSLIASPSGDFTVEVLVSGRIGRATAKHKARAICFAVAHAVGITPVSNPASEGDR